jgi:hypothetical protein
VVGDALFEEILLCDIGRSEEEIADVIDQDSSVLLRHPTVEAAEAGFDVKERDVSGVGSKPSGKGGVRVTLDDECTWPMVGQVAIEGGSRKSDLAAPRLATDLEVCFGLRETEGL